VKKILIIGAGTLQVPAIIEAKKMGYYVATFDLDNNAPGFKLADESYVISTIDIEAAVSKAREIRPDGVMTLASDMPLRTVAAIAKELSLKAISEETAYFATNKARMREKLQENGVPIPKFYIADDLTTFEKSVGEFKGERFIVKPADNSGSRGVHLCDDITDIYNIYKYSKRYSRSGEVLIEEYMEGQEVSVETFAINGNVYVIAITDKLTTKAPYFVEMGHSQPSRFDIINQDKISNIAIQSVKALGIMNGPSHVEVMVTRDGPKIVELGARLGGDNITTHLVPISTGVNLVESTIKQALGEVPNITRTQQGAAVIRYFQSPVGKIISINGIEETKKVFGVKEINLIKDVGDFIQEVQNSTDRIGFIICGGANLEEVIEQCDKALNAVKITTE
jgi:biotin carboxylase